MLHRHNWYSTGNLLLSLWDAEGYADCVLTWACRDCPEEVVLTASLHADAVLRTPDDATPLIAAERREGTPLARQAVQQERRTRGLHRRRY